MPQVMTIYGTRPEAIKVAPVIRALERSEDLRSVTVVTGQHREMLDQVNEVFGIVPDHDLDVFAHGQTLNALMSKVFDRVDPVLRDRRPDAVLVQGDTSTVAAVAIAAFYRQIPVLHLEAGLRSGDIASPFPEEANRRLTSQVASLHLAPTAGARRNLERENVDASSIVVTGNTVIDALLHAATQRSPIADVRLQALMDSGRPVLLVTTHRRENWGPAMEGVGRALRRIALAFPEQVIVLPAHRNPVVRESLLPPLHGLPNVLVTEPLPYADFTQVLARSHIVLTDSGGVQEEAPSLGKPVLVMRANTERPEAVSAGTVRLVGTDEDRLVREVSTLVTDRAAYDLMSNAVNPYGDGGAAARVCAAVRAFFGHGERMPDFA
ncbi:MAG TPA: UDP-N-acetylglucosamine 2-epimerase (non-hydrolyzing) [Ornithinibacter sp.]|jgi:UDP-N-acetylglucosamine 2-epimerase (non-hydrolysing)|nr:UDP-N-acetylglucosamine 2-epimerase (non-hydrolyzing) [Ornithinibacter sp.]